MIINIIIRTKSQAQTMLGPVCLKVRAEVKVEKPQSHRNINQRNADICLVTGSSAWMQEIKSELSTLQK